MQLAPAGKGYILEMPESPLLLNHVGTVHASVQFALAEASSGEFLLRHLGEAQSRVFAVTYVEPLFVEASFWMRRPTTGRSTAVKKISCSFFS